MKLNGSWQEYSCCLLNIIRPGEELFSWWSSILPSSQLPRWCSSQPGGGWKMGKGWGRERGVGHTALREASLSKYCWCHAFSVPNYLLLICPSGEIVKSDVESCFTVMSQAEKSRLPIGWEVSLLAFFLLITVASQFCITKLKSFTGLPGEKPERRLLGSGIWKEPSACHFAITNILDIS